MSDLVIREVDGWHEVTELVDPERVDHEGLWAAIAQGNFEKAEDILWEGLYPESQEDYGFLVGSGRRTPIVRLIDFPDDIRGWYRRIWIKRL